MSDFESKAREIFNRYDTNNSGSIEKKELVLYLHDIFKFFGLDLPQDQLEAATAEGIKKYDLNGDGVLQFNEFADLLRYLVEEKGLFI